MRSIFTSRLAKVSVAATVAALGLVATTTGAEAAWCAQWRHGYCVDWRYNSYYYNPGPAAALNAFAGAVAAATTPQYYYPPPSYGYYYAPRYGYYPPAYGYYGPEPSYGLVIR
jgi:hypothetical protein